MPRNRIDVHSHYLGGVVPQLLARIGLDESLFPKWSPQIAIDFMDRYEIATQILSLPVSLTARPDDPAFAARIAREVNEAYADLIREHPERFGAFAAIPADSTDHALAEIAYALDELKLDGVLLTSNAGGEYFGDPFYEPILAELDRRGIPVLIHPEANPHLGEVEFGRTGAIVEFPFDTARNITNGIYKGVFTRYPGLKIILAHCGGALPTLGWRIAELTALRGPNDADVGPAHIAEVLRGLYYETALAASRNSLLPTLEVTNPDHILFGTDWPAAPEPIIARNVDNLAGFDALTGPELTAIDRSNTLPLFPRLA